MNVTIEQVIGDYMHEHCGEWTWEINDDYPLEMVCVHGRMGEYRFDHFITSVEARQMVHVHARRMLDVTTMLAEIDRALAAPLAVGVTVDRPNMTLTTLGEIILDSIIEKVKG